MKRTAALLVILVTAACSRTSSPEAGELRVVPLAGEVSLVDGHETSLLDEATTVDSGIAISTGSDGRAEVQLSGGQRIELAPGTELRVDNEFSEVADGSVLVRTQSPLMIRAGGAEIEASDAIFRVDREASVLLAMYSGQAAVLGSGVESVPALRQANVLQGGEIAGGIKPLKVRENDPWDVELLGAAIDLGTELLDLETGLSHQLPRGRESSAVSAVLERDFPPRDIRSAISLLGNAARAVVAAVVAQEAARIDGITESLRRILAEVVDLQVFGASWIVVVAEWGLPAAASALTRELRGIAAAIADAFAPPPAPLTSSSNVSGSEQTLPTDPGPSGSGNPKGDPPDRNVEPKPPPPPPEGGGDGAQPPATCANQVECAVDDILDGPGTPSAPASNP